MLLGLFFIFDEKYSMKRVKGKINIEDKKVDKKKGFFRYKILLGVLSIVLGIFAIINYIIY